MAVTIANTALLISAPTGQLERDMKSAQKVVGDGAKRMKDEVDRKGSLWGNWFRGAFAMSQLNKLTRAVREGTQALRESGDAASVAAAQGLAEYDHAVKQIEASIAKAFSKPLAFVGKQASLLAEELEAIADIVKHDVFGDGLDAEMARRVQITNELERQRKIQEQIKQEVAEWHALLSEFGPKVAAMRDPLENWFEEVQRINHALKVGIFEFDSMAGDLLKHAAENAKKAMGFVLDTTPFDVFLERIKSIERATIWQLLDEPLAGELMFQEAERLLEKLNLIESRSPFEKWQEAVSNLSRMLRAGIIDEARHVALLGQQTQILIDAQERINEVAAKGPEALVRGTAAAFSAIREFNARRPQSEVNVADAIKRAAQEQDKRDKEIIRVGTETNRILDEFRVVGR